MSAGRMPVHGQPGTWVSGKRARWLVAARRARILPNGELQILHGAAHAQPADGRDPIASQGPPIEWSAYSSCGVRNRTGIRWLNGYHMNGDAINHGR